jgi:hypothetical protein
MARRRRDEETQSIHVELDASELKALLVAQQSEVKELIREATAELRGEIAQVTARTESILATINELYLHVEKRRDA